MFYVFKQGIKEGIKDKCFEEIPTRDTGHTPSCFTYSNKGYRIPTFAPFRPYKRKDDNSILFFSCLLLVKKKKKILVGEQLRTLVSKFYYVKQRRDTYLFLREKILKAKSSFPFAPLLVIYFLQKFNPFSRSLQNYRVCLHSIMHAIKKEYKIKRLYSLSSAKHMMKDT